MAKLSNEQKRLIITTIVNLVKRHDNVKTEKLVDIIFDKVPFEPKLPAGYYKVIGGTKVDVTNSEK